MKEDRIGGGDIDQRFPVSTHRLVPTELKWTSSIALCLAGVGLLCVMGFLSERLGKVQANEWASMVLWAILGVTTARFLVRTAPKYTLWIASRLLLLCALLCVHCGIQQRRIASPTAYRIFAVRLDLPPDICALLMTVALSLTLPAAMRHTDSFGWARALPPFLAHAWLCVLLDLWMGVPRWALLHVLLLTALFLVGEGRRWVSRSSGLP